MSAETIGSDRTAGRSNSTTWCCRAWCRGMVVHYFDDAGGTSFDQHEHGTTALVPSGDGQRERDSVEDR